jgi:hypothetical protein
MRAAGEASIDFESAELVPDAPRQGAYPSQKPSARDHQQRDCCHPKPARSSAPTPGRRLRPRLGDAAGPSMPPLASSTSRAPRVVLQALQLAARGRLGEFGRRRMGAIELLLELFDAHGGGLFVVRKRALTHPVTPSPSRPGCNPADVERLDARAGMQGREALTLADSDRHRR